MGYQYKIGMYGGSFNPLHLGHVDCILQAANLCEQLYVVLSVGNCRDEIDYRVRYRWLYQLTKHIGNVTIFMLQDTAATKQAYTEEYWQQDSEIVKRQIGEKIDVVFCGSDYDADSFWNVCYPESTCYIFQRNEMNSTQIREDPYQYWAWLPQVVRPYYVKKVLLIGSESTGKSTLTINLAHHFNTNYIDEAGRELSERSGTDLLMLSEDFTEILLQHKMNEIEAVKYSNKLLFIDTDALVTQFYMSFLQDPNIEKNRALSDALDALNQYDLILFLEPDVTFVQDGDRSPVIAKERKKYSNQIKTLLEQHGKQYLRISGSYQKRYLDAIQAVHKMMHLPDVRF